MPRAGAPQPLAKAARRAAASGRASGGMAAPNSAGLHGTPESALHVLHVERTCIAARSGSRRTRQALRPYPCQRLSTSVPFVPPKPNEFDSAYSIASGRAALAA